MTADQVHQLLDIITPCVLAALFVISLLIKLDQAKNKAALLAHQQEVKDKLESANEEMKESFSDLKSNVNVHIAEDALNFYHITATLQRIENKQNEKTAS